MKLSYKPEIDGLRSIAVLSVILYHAQIVILGHDVFRGGFVGVDIFFVISGYLITQSLYSLSQENCLKISLFKFYKSRVRRILPALMFMLLLTFLASYFLLTEFYFKSFLQQLVSSSFGVSNFLFYKTSGYFDIESEMKPLLHTWSLAIEEQFYLIFPIMFLILINRNIKYLVAFLSLFFIVSFGSTLYFANNLNLIFYVTLFRAFELLFGSLLAIFTLYNSQFRFSKNLSINLKLLGFAMIIFSVFYLDKSYTWPSIYTLIPLFGASLILINIENEKIGILKNVFMVNTGKISYSLYLYHWPLMFFLNYLNLIPPIKFTLYFIGSYLLALLSYKFIESPFRFGRLKNTKYTIIFWAAITSGIVFITSIEDSKESFLPYKGKDLIQENLLKEINPQRFKNVTESDCKINGEGLENCKKNKILVIGNSHLPDGYNFIYETLKIMGISSYSIISAGNSNHLNCHYKFYDNHIKSETGKCEIEANVLNDEEFIKSVDILFISYFRLKDWGSVNYAFVNKFYNINPNLKIMVLGGYIGIRPNNCAQIINKVGDYNACSDISLRTYSANKDEYWYIDEFYNKRFISDNFFYIDRYKFFCNPVNDYCPTSYRNKPFFYDGDHWSYDGIRFFAQEYYKLNKNKLEKFFIKP